MESDDRRDRTAGPSYLLHGLLFAILWTAWMVWWTGADSLGRIVVLALFGLAVGMGWVWAMRRVMRRLARPREPGRSDQLPR